MEEPMERVSGDVRRIPVTIYDRDYLVRTDETVQHINQLAHLLDGKMREISGGNPNIMEVKVAVLAALTILDDRIKIQDKYEELLTYLGNCTDPSNEQLEEIEGQRTILEYE
jgi:cell division protein ZapA